MKARDLKTVIFPSDSALFDPSHYDLATEDVRSDGFSKFVAQAERQLSLFSVSFVKEYSLEKHESYNVSSNENSKEDSSEEDRFLKAWNLARRKMQKVIFVDVFMVDTKFYHNKTLSEPRTQPLKPDEVAPENAHNQRRIYNRWKYYMIPLFFTAYKGRN